MHAITSPCVRNCCLDDDDICIGCLRSLDEIKDWQSKTDQQKLEVLKFCRERKRLRDQRDRE